MTIKAYAANMVTNAEVRQIVSHDNTYNHEGNTVNYVAKHNIKTVCNRKAMEQCNGKTYQDDLTSNFLDS